MACGFKVLNCSLAKAMEQLSHCCFQVLKTNFLKQTYMQRMKNKILMHKDIKPVNLKRKETLSK